MSFSILIIINLRHTEKNSNSIFKIDFIFILISFALPVLVSHQYLHDYSVWLDEYTEYLVAFLSDDLVFRSASTQQPPLGIFFRKMGLNFFGVNEFGLRVASTFFFGLLGSVNYLLIKAFTKSISYSILGSFFISLNIWLITYSTEARPYTISIFFCAVFLYFFYDHFRSQTTTKKINVAVVISSLLWLLSISMQPLLFVLIIFVIYALISFLHKDPFSISIVKSLGASLIIYSPILYLIVTSSTSYIRHDIMNIQELVKLFFTQDLWLVRTLFAPNKIYSYMACFMAGTYFIIAYFNLNFRKMNVFLGFIVGIYLLTLIVLFHLKVNWFLQHRYLLTVLLLCYYLFLISLYSLNIAHSFKILILSALLAVSAFSIYSDGVRKSIGTDWRQLYQLLDDKTVVRSQGFIFSFENPGTWCDEMFLAKEFYPTKSVFIASPNTFLFPTIMTNDEIFSKLSQIQYTENIFFIITRHSLKEVYFDSLKFSNFEAFKLSDFYVINIKKDSLHSAIKSFYAQLENLMSADENRLRIYDGLFLISLYEKNCIAAEKYFKTLVNLINSDKERLKNYLPRSENHEKAFKLLCPNRHL